MQKKIYTPEEIAQVRNVDIFAALPYYIKSNCIPYSNGTYSNGEFIINGSRYYSSKTPTRKDNAITFFMEELNFSFPGAVEHLLRFVKQP